MSKSGQLFIAATQGTRFTLYSTMKAMGIPLSEEQEKTQAYLERHYPPVVDFEDHTLDDAEEDWKRDKEEGP